MKVHHLVVHNYPSKFGFMHLALRNTRDYVNQDGLLRSGIFNTVESSLKLLDTPYIDVLQIHRFDLRAEVKEMICERKVGYIDASSMKMWRFFADEPRRGVEWMDAVFEHVE
ncbi:hypothetical protein B0H14DRAFT_2605529 [Mycena olivaceomarginata]|nr:hypothetical protein B0H14DRAFT_2605529 [Mycena olivaceomarginata]